ncbi:uncharacterized protein SPPG_07632 [Spizellomyces punctatus DAOM BR117]|uniref:Uncharacterized protein n=1 Tax=Spizellomyces punctatus (strain DAOM BR117) TaxID=645134 RepID=A0A0L0H6V8_SPIPD|nr:uncharacterized protein SPPG_07632 [Spizellomyces punctatus DAOM BR117]KNC97245.1 hypothetical protein SPPG_07632 [Spizellomyces punctatus DAOM BR117]|eukprot:XP_016605285.1 hypothetical protein SPPG_07632 [Spizellomyces punctatus DAOM BR117]
MAGMVSSGLMDSSQGNERLACKRVRSEYSTQAEPDIELRSLWTPPPSPIATVATICPIAHKMWFTTPTEDLNRKRSLDGESTQPLPAPSTVDLMDVDLQPRPALSILTQCFNHVRTTTSSPTLLTLLDDLLRPSLASWRAHFNLLFLTEIRHAHPEPSNVTTTGIFHLVHYLEDMKTLQATWQAAAGHWAWLSGAITVGRTCGSWTLYHKVIQQLVVYWLEQEGMVHAVNEYRALT